MCDYSLHGVASRPAKVGDKLVSSGFRNSITRGFSASNEPGVAICLLPGTELAFESNVEGYATSQGGTIKKFEQTVARFRQVNLDNPVAHHDALEFPGGETILVTNLCEGQRATVLQLPSTGQRAYTEHHEAAPAPVQEPLVTSRS
jgi:hypothetical protein